MDTPLIFTNEEKFYEGKCQKGSECCISTSYYFTKGEIIQDQTIQPSGFPNGFSNFNAYFKDNCGNITISNCQFLNCYTKGASGGGGLLIEQYCDIKLHNSIFNYCRSVRHGSGASISERININYNQPNHPIIESSRTNDIFIQYCCFSNCYAEENNGFGSAIIMSSKIVRLFYASTVNCPGYNQKQFRGAQFDIDGVNLSSQFVNATGGNSIYCGAMEYRNALTGFFQFQTITQMNCKYAISFTSVDINGLRITTCNINNNKLNTVSTEDKNANPPALVFVQKKNLVLEDFYFYNNDFGEKGKYAVKENVDDIKITLINCYSNNPNKNLINTQYVITQNCIFTDRIIHTTQFDLLKLGSCQGEKKPGPLIISSFFTPSAVFTQSSLFTNSKAFTYSSSFNESSIFSSSNSFSYSNIFSQSKSFNPSKSFTSSQFFSGSNEFNSSKVFSKSKCFSKSDSFSSSNEFTKSDTFSDSKEFTKSDTFYPTGQFSNSGTFSPSNQFTKSFEFTLSDSFTSSNYFTKSSAFLASSNFSPSKNFTQSDSFTSSNQFTKSDSFTASNQFTKSRTFSPSKDFTNSKTFTSSNQFTKSNTFSPSKKFTNSKSFTSSNKFTKSNTFSASNEFTESRPFTPSNQFTKSNSFSFSSLFSASQPLFVIYIPTQESSQNGKKIAMIVGISAASAAAVAGIIFGVVFFLKKTNLLNHENVYIKMKKAEDTPNTIENPLRNMMGDNDDPFEDDFDIDDIN